MSIETENTPLEVEATTPEIKTSTVKESDTELVEVTNEGQVKTKKPKILLFVLLGLIFLAGAAYATFYFTTSESSNEVDLSTDSSEQEEQLTEIETEITPCTEKIYELSCEEECENRWQTSGIYKTLEDSGPQLNFREEFVVGETNDCYVPLCSPTTTDETKICYCFPPQEVE